MEFQYNILKVSSNGANVFFECSNGDYGVLEPIDCELSVGDILNNNNVNVKPCCGFQELVLNNRRKVKIHVEDLNVKERAYELFIRRN